MQYIIKMSADTLVNTFKFNINSIFKNYSEAHIINAKNLSILLNVTGIIF